MLNDIKKCIFVFLHEYMVYKFHKISDKKLYQTCVYKQNKFVQKFVFDMYTQKLMRKMHICHIYNAK